jgi:D-glycero-alpha-D-manno-heptose-7-phosphate kinase
MIVSRTPFRISFFGGGTDYPAWYREHGGAVLATSIDKYCYLTCRYLPPFFEHRYRVVYSFIETVSEQEAIQHPSAREVIRFMKLPHGVEIHHDGDLPARSGMGSSSAFTVGLLHALHALKGEMPSKHQLARESIAIEQEILKETVGSQDQVLAAFGGLNHVTFHSNGEISVQPMTLSRERLDELSTHLMLFYTGIKRTASDVAKSYVSDIDSKKCQLRVMRDLVEEAVALLNSTSDLIGFGQLLHEAWLVKRSLSVTVTNPEVDAIYEAARSVGAIGGKLTGAGGGGFMLLFAPPERHQIIRERLKKLLLVPFKFDYAGSQIIFYDPGEDYAEAHAHRAQQQIGAFKELTDLANDQPTDRRE